MSLMFLNGGPPVSWNTPPPLIQHAYQNITLEDADIRWCDGNALVVRGSNIVNPDAGVYDE